MLNDLTYALRMLRARPAFAFAAIATLTVGIGATTAIFSTVNAALLRPLPYASPDDLYTLGTRLTDGRFSTGLIAPSEMFALNEAAPSVVKAVLVAKTDTSMTPEAAAAGAVNVDRESVQVVVYSTSEGFVELFGLPLALGQGFTADDFRPFQPPAPGGPPARPQAPSAILSYHLWQDQFGRDPNVLGKTMRMAAGQATIVGVAAPEFNVPAGTDLWLNGRFGRQSIAHSFTGYLRAKPGTTPERLTSEMASVMAGVAKQFPTSATGRAYTFRPLVQGIVGDLGPILIVVLGGAGLLLLLAAVNVTNLLLARSAVRSREIALRTAMGAPRVRIIRQLLTESLVLAACGTAAGLALAFTGVRLLQRFGAATLPRLDRVPFDGRVLLFSLAVMLVTVLLIGLVPALRLARVDLRTLLNESSRSATRGRSTHRLLSGMVVAEIAVAITLVAGAGWLVRSFMNLSNTNAGFVPQGRLVFDVFLPGERYARGDAAAVWMASVTERLRAIGGVTDVGATSVIPLRPERDVAYYVGTNLRPDDPSHQLTARLRTAGPGFFKAMGVRLIAGREFSSSDRRGEGSAPAAIVNRAFVRAYLDGRDPMTEPFYWGFPTVNRRTAFSILGVVDDMKYDAVGNPAEPAFYLPMGAGFQQTMVVASTLADPASIIANVRDAIHSVDPTLPITPVPMSTIVAASLARQRLGLTLMLMFAAAALVLAAIGIYGVIAYASSQRLGEVATRMALGATPAHVFWMMLRQGRTLAVAGTVVGLAAAYAAGRLVSSWLYEISASDPLILVSAVVMVLIITMLAIVVPARRTSRIDLADTLRLQ